MDRRIRSVSRFLTEYSQGRFGRKLEVSGPPDELNACLAGFNILGEELEARTISRDYFTNIVNSVSDMVFILSTGGEITYVNRRVGEQLRYEPEHLLGKPMDELLEAGRIPVLQPILKRLRRSREPVTLETVLHSPGAGTIPVHLAASWLHDKKAARVGIVVTAKDITQQLQAENRILRVIIDTQEKERQRLARDLHDGLGQKISAIKFWISGTAETCGEGGQKEILLRSNEALVEVLAEMRAMCFDLMPQTLREFGLVRAVKELSKQLEQTDVARIIVRHGRQFTPFEKGLEIDLFRIIQEFISNAIKHGRAHNIWIDLNRKNGLTSLGLRDDGVGFDMEKRQKGGMGLQNSISRVRSHGGEMKIRSRKGRGTEIDITVNDKKEEPRK